MTLPEPTTGVRAPATTSADGVGAGDVATPKVRGKRTPKLPRVQRESPNEDGWLGAIELVTATFTWGGIGYLVDRFLLDTYPVFMSIGFVVGFFAGMYLLWLKSSTTGEDAAAAARTKTAEGGGGVDS